ncbi:MFS transporter [Snodgrassella alvi]|jgi:MFS family permease|uniref:MFS transporter n=1 Tax=Snodgrassella alvi TaxID=1196083 RepID=UPI000C1F2467|nr:MFS transporter [Snodgrassella alvi]PIT45235.1 MFS transporter [Snodgrassella alvi]PIT56351.1 MFS transporter [Snodgrassella alvi]
MFTWYRAVSRNEKKTFWACFSGWALDALENQMFGLVIPSLLAYFAISKGQAGLLSSATLVTSALGGWFAGALSDRYGRVRTLQIMIIWFAFFTFLAAFVTDYHWLLVLKALQGFGIGGEWAAGAVLMAETISTQYRGKVMAIVQSAWAVGWGLAVILFSVTFSLAPENIAWRIMFAVGLLPSLLIFYIRRHVQEPEKQNEEIPKTEDKQPIISALFGIFSPSLIRTTLLGGLLGLGAHGGYHAIMSWLPTYLKEERNLSVLNSSVYLAVIIFAFWCGCMASSVLLDKIGRRFNVALFAICCVITVRIYLFAPLNNTQMLFLGFPLGFFAAGIPSSLGALFNELYPQQYRGAGVGFCYNFGRILSSIFPFLVGHMSASMSLGSAIGIDASWAYSIVVISVLLLPETKGRDLKQINQAGQIFDK